MDPCFIEDIPVKSYKALFKLAKSLHLYHDTDGLLGFITREILKFIDVQGTTVLLVDEEKKECYYRAAAFNDKKLEEKIKKIRFPCSKGMIGKSLKTGKPPIVSDIAAHQNKFFFDEIETNTGYKIENMLDVPMRVHNRIIGILSAVNKKESPFNNHDIELLSALADTVAHPVENAGINQKLARSYKEVKSLNSAKDKVIHHLSHELKTPVSILAASLEIIETKLKKGDTQNFSRVFNRAKRNLQRLLEMQYEIEDILLKKDYTTFHILSRLFNSCKDQLEVLITKEMGGREVIKRIETEIEDLFGPQEVVYEKIYLNKFADKALRTLGFRFANRECRIIKDLNKVPKILIPEDILMKIFEGLIKNSVENTPDKGEIKVTVKKESSGVLLAIKDTGIGITEENMNLIFENYFTAYETSAYSSGKAYDFGAGGNGFDLLRMKIFSEQFNFKIKINSTRCPYLIENNYICPGDIDKCEMCSSMNDCKTSGGTEVSVYFLNHHHAR